MAGIITMATFFLNASAAGHCSNAGVEASASGMAASACFAAGSRPPGRACEAVK